MNHEIYPYQIFCPYCAQIFEILVDPSVSHQKYIEDCEVCCRPISLDVFIQTDGQAQVNVLREEDDY